MQANYGSVSMAVAIGRTAGRSMGVSLNRKNRRFSSRLISQLEDIDHQKLTQWQRIFLGHEGLTSDKYLHYWRVYEGLFGSVPQGVLLEIGVAEGGSLEILSQLLPGWRFVGLDVNPEILNLSIPRVQLLNGSQTDPVILDKSLKAIGGAGFDVVIDDGSHVQKDINTSLRHLWPHLRHGGSYIIEDVHTSYWQEFGGGLRKRSSAIEYAKTLVDQIHRDYIWKLRHNRDSSDLPGLDSVRFYDSMIVLTKMNDTSDYSRVIVPDR
jgi:hypothetical protein